MSLAAAFHPAQSGKGFVLPRAPSSLWKMRMESHPSRSSQAAKGVLWPRELRASKSCHEAPAPLQDELEMKHKQCQGSGDVSSPGTEGVRNLEDSCQ